MKQYDLAGEHYHYALSLEPSLTIAKDNLLKLHAEDEKETLGLSIIVFCDDNRWYFDNLH